MDENLFSIFQLESECLFLELVTVEKNDISVFWRIGVVVLFYELLAKRFQKLIATAPRLVGKFPEDMDQWVIGRHAFFL
ncbi:hypothetical protein [Chlorobium sp.]|uniref:hypothetical protein n=1 Tax=Chlorobium sp. TaxID=1095 RepID=UPI003C4E27AF